MSEEIDRWIAYMEENPDKWKSVHSEFIDAQFEKQKAFLERLKEQPGGKERIKEIYGIENEKGYPGIFQ